MVSSVALASCVVSKVARTGMFIDVESSAGDCGGRIQDIVC